MKHLRLWGTVVTKFVAPWFLVTSSSNQQQQQQQQLFPLSDNNNNNGGGRPTATRLATEFQQVYRRLEHSSDTFMIPPNMPTLKFSQWKKPSSIITKQETRSSSAASAATINNNDDDDVSKKEEDDTSSSEIFPQKPLVLYLPGLDGYGISAVTHQFDDLSRAFDFWHMTMDSRNDRSSFRDLMQAVHWFLQEKMYKEEDDEKTTTTTTMTMNKSNNENDLVMDQQQDEQQQRQQRQRIYLIGESFGGLLAPAVVIQAQQQNKRQKQKLNKQRQFHKDKNNDDDDRGIIIDGMVLVNPATSFSQSNWDLAGPLLGLLDTTDFDDLDKNVTTSSSTSSSSSSLLPSLYSLVGGTFLAATVPSALQLQRFLQDTLLNIPRSTPNDWIDIGQGMKMAWDGLQYRLPGATVQHRIREWLMVGDAVVTKQRWKESISSTTPTVLVVGSEDHMLPSQEHAKELEQLQQQGEEFGKGATKLCETVVVKDGGHFVLDDRVNLTKIMIRSKVLDPVDYWATRRKSKTAKSYDPITDWTLPPPNQVATIIEQGVGPLRKWFSPVFFSTDPKTGRRWKGLSKLPSLVVDKKDLSSSLSSSSSNVLELVNEGDDDDDDPSIVTGPILLVGNHQFAGLDLGMVIAQLMEERNWTVRGLAHPVLFGSNVSSSTTRTGGGMVGGAWIPPSNDVDNEDEDEDDDDDSTDSSSSSTTTPWSVFNPSTMKKFGAVQVTPRNYYRLLETGQNVLLFPGGVREVFHGRNEAYQIFWPDKKNKPDFCRTAAKFNATIIPVCGIGMADTFQILLDSSDLAQLPWIGDRIRQQSSQVSAARFDANQNDELFQPPLAFPTLPARNYFLFGRPISTRHVSHQDREACAALYQQVQTEMRQGLADLVAARDHDPFHVNNTLQRLLYEQVTGKQAPTFPVDVLNRRQTKRTN